MSKKSLITRTKDTCGGMPRIRGTRITVQCVKAWYKWEGIETILKMYPYINENEVKAAINYCRKVKIK
jgi:uncharacterized protein (DUF433 family)